MSGDLAFEGTKYGNKAQPLLRIANGWDGGYAGSIDVWLWFTGVYKKTLTCRIETRSFGEALASALSLFQGFLLLCLEFLEVGLFCRQAGNHVVARHRHLFMLRIFWNEFVKIWAPH